MRVSSVRLPLMPHVVVLCAGLYRGLDTKLAQTVLAAAILFTTRESITRATRRALTRGKAA